MTGCQLTHTSATVATNETLSIMVNANMRCKVEMSKTLKSLHFYYWGHRIHSVCTFIYNRVPWRIPQWNRKSSSHGMHTTSNNPTMQCIEFHRLENYCKVSENENKWVISNTDNIYLIQSLLTLANLSNHKLLIQWYRPSEAAATKPLSGLNWARLHFIADDSAFHL